VELSVRSPVTKKKFYGRNSFVQDVETFDKFTLKLCVTYKWNVLQATWPYGVCELMGNVGQTAVRPSHGGTAIWHEQTHT